MSVTTTDLSAIDPIRHREAMGLARTAYERFAAVVETLSDEDWSRSTDCDGWTVRDLVGHVVGAMRAAASARELLSQQREIKERVKADGGNETDAMTRVQIDRTAGLDPAALARECRDLVERATAGRRRTPAPLRRLVSFPVEIGTIRERWRLGYLVDVILTRDAWLHRIDLCRAMGVEPQLTADHDGRIIADVVAEWARRHGRPFHLVLTGPGGGEFRDGDPPSAVHHELDAVELARILSGRAPGEGLLGTEVPF
jgi:uncharacterized protein (TIGR03083 family)